MIPSVFNPINLSESVNTVIGIDLDRLVQQNNSSYFKETLNFVIETQKEFNLANKNFYKAIVESTGNEEVIQESFGDFFTKIGEIISKFLDFIKRLFDKFILNLNSFIKREKYITKHEKDLAKFSTIHEFRYNGYEFIFSPEIPAINALAEFSDGFVFGVDAKTDSPYLKSDSSGSSLKNALSIVNNELSNGKWYDNFRASVINADSPILQADYADELFKVFRNGDTSKEDIDITSTVVNMSLNRLKAHDKAVSTVKVTKDRIDSEYNSIKKKVENMLKINYKNGNRMANIYDDSKVTARPFTGDEISTMDLLAKAKTTQVQEMSTIHALAFSAKLDALNDCFKQDKAILFMALSKVNAIGKEN